MGPVTFVNDTTGVEHTYPNLQRARYEMGVFFDAAVDTYVSLEEHRIRRGIHRFTFKTSEDGIVLTLTQIVK